MANEININPTPLGSATQSIGPRRMVSDVTIAEQFCTVANDMRNVLQTMRTSLELQRQMIDMFGNTMALFQENNDKIEKSMEVQTETMGLLREFMDRNSQHTETLTRNSLMITRSLLNDTSFAIISSKVDNDLKVMSEGTANADANTSTGSSS
jgi:hypothetical protein